MESRHVIGPNEIPESLPLLDYISQVLLRERKPFLNRKIIAVQHLLGSTIPLLKKLEDGGARPEDIYLVGKAYSSHPLVVERLIERGYILSFEDVFSHDERLPYDSILETHILQTCVRMLAESHFDSGFAEKGLIIDDGGKAIHLLHTEYPYLLPYFSSAEQTSRGARLLQNVSLEIPAINVARSETKTIHESPSIAEAMVSEFLLTVNRWEEMDVYHLRNKHAFVLGYGFIGEGVVQRLLKAGFTVSVFDPDENRMQKARNTFGEIVEPDRKSAYPKAGVVIGCSGTPSIPDDEFSLIQSGTLLVNMASTDLEFRAWNLRETGTIVHQEVLPSDIEYLQEFSPLSWRCLYHITKDGADFYLMNGGFPSDFSGKVNPVPVEEIQLTAALLLGASVQAVESQEKGLIDLDQDLQMAVIDEYLRLQGE